MTGAQGIGAAGRDPDFGAARIAVESHIADGPSVSAS